MTSVFQLFASIALALPAFPASESAFAPVADLVADRAVADALWTDAIWTAALDPVGLPLRITPPPAAAPVAGAPAPGAMAGPLGVDSWNQVRIEQQVIIRISPREPGRDSLAPQALPIPPMMHALNAPPVAAPPLNPQLLTTNSPKPPLHPTPPHAPAAQSTPATRPFPPPA